MNPSVSIRSASSADARGVLEIYAPFILKSSVSFEQEVPSLPEMEARMAKYQQGNPWLICEWEGKVAGYAYGMLHRERHAYQWTREVSAYVHPDFHRRGIARALYTSLFALQKTQGVHNLLAGITMPNEQSVAFHRALGFKLVGTYHGIGYKFGAWRDVSWWEMRLQPFGTQPAPLLTPREMQASGAWEQHLQAGKKFLKV